MTIMTQKPKQTPGDGGISSPGVYASIENAEAGARARILTLPNGLTITAGEFEDMGYESQRAWLTNMANTPLEDLE